MGALSTGSLAWLSAGVYGLTLGLPAAVRLAPHDRLSWSDVLIQLVVAAGGLGWDVWRARRHSIG